LPYIPCAEARISRGANAVRLWSGRMLRALLPIAIVVSCGAGAPADEGFNIIRDTRIVIHKGKRTLELHRNGDKIAEYRVCLGGAPRGPKRITGDCKTPEGDYFICTKSTASHYCRFLGISYPGGNDAQTAFERGLISRNTRDAIISRVSSGQSPPWDTKLGGWVGIHGYPTDQYRNLWVVLFYPKPHNWTDGCIAMWNFEIEDLFSKVFVGTPISILP
jgi:murein L,D-transpeptidase YafK